MTEEQKSGFNAWVLRGFGVSTAAVLIILSERGPGLLETLKAVPALLEAWSRDSPIGVWTLLAALVLPSLLSVKLHSWLGVWSNRHAKAVLIDFAGFFGGVAIAYALIPTLPGFLLGVFCASLVSTLTAWIRAVCLALERKRAKFDSSAGSG